MACSNERLPGGTRLQCWRLSARSRRWLLIIVPLRRSRGESSPCRFLRLSAPPCGCWPGPSRMPARADPWPPRRLPTSQTEVVVVRCSATSPRAEPPRRNTSRGARHSHGGEEPAGSRLAGLDAYDSATGDRLAEAIAFLRALKESDQAYAEARASALERYAGRI